jgi:hypothetical protein
MVLFDKCNFIPMVLFDKYNFIPMVMLISPALFSCRGGIILFVCRQPQLIHMVDKTATGIPADWRSCVPCLFKEKGFGYMIQIGKKWQILFKNFFNNHS